MKSMQEFRLATRHTKHNKNRMLTPREGGNTNCIHCGAIVSQGALCAECWARIAFTDEHQNTQDQ